MKTPLFGRFGEAHTDQHSLGPIQQLDLAKMQRYGPEDAVDFVIVGTGAAGGVLAQRLARAGFRVVAFDAGPFWDVERDWVSDEAGSHKLYWNDLRITGGPDPITMGANNSGKGVGGGTVHWAAFTPRFHPSDFRVYSQDGLGADWPIAYQDIKPYYELMERELPVAGPPNYPWGEPHGYPYGPHPTGAVTDLLTLGCTRLGIRVVTGGPVAINSGSHADRPHCIYRGFCIQGCKVGAKQSTLYSHVPDAIQHGAEVRGYKVPPANGLTEEFHETDPQRGFARGFAIQTIGPLPISFAKQMMVAKGAWGWGLRQVMMDYNHWAAFGFLGGILPWPDNRVTLAEGKDQFGLPVAKVHVALHENDKKLIEWGVKKTMEVMWAAGAEEVVQEPRYAHLVGAARMGSDPRTSVVDSFGCSHDIPNLFVCVGSILPTQGSANPGLTIQALAARTGDYLISERENILHRQPTHRPVGSVRIRRDLSPPGGSGRGIPVPK